MAGLFQLVDEDTCEGSPLYPSRYGLWTACCNDFIRTPKYRARVLASFRSITAVQENKAVRIRGKEEGLDHVPINLRIMTVKITGLSHLAKATPTVTIQRTFSIYSGHAQPALRARHSRR